MRVLSDLDVAFAKPAGREAKLSHMGHATMENRHGRADMLTLANGTAERRSSEGILKIKTPRSPHHYR